MKKIFLVIILMFGYGATAQAALESYTVNQQNSHIKFSFTHAGNQFEGEFKDWSAVIKYDAADIGKSSIRVEIKMASSNTGNALYDKTLPGKEWFDTADFPTAVYESNAILKNNDGSFTSKGMLKLKDKEVPVEFTFAMDPKDLSSSPVKTSFSFNLDRMILNLGLSSDPKAEWVSKEVKVTVSLEASKSAGASS